MRIKIRVYAIGAMLLFLVCFFKSFWSDETVYEVLRVSMIAGAAVLFLAAKRKGGPINWLEGLWIILIAVPIFSNLIASNKDSSMSATIAYTVQYICILTYALLCRRNESYITAGYKVMAIYLVPLVACTIIFYFTPGFYLNTIIHWFDRSTELRRGYLSGNMSGLTSHYSTNGMYMVLAFILAFSNLLNQNAGKGKRYAILIVTFVALFMTGKRAHAIFGVASCIFALFLYKSDKPRGRILKILFAVAVGLVLFGILASILPNIKNPFIRLFDSMEKDDLTTGRTVLWASAIDYFKSSPVFGIGFKKFNKLTGYDVHNVYLQLLCETGIVGFVLYIFPIFTTYFMGVRTLIAERKYRQMGLSVKQQQYLLVAVCYQTFFLIYCMTGNSLYDLPTLFPYMFCVGTTMYFYRLRRFCMQRVTVCWEKALAE